MARRLVLVLLLLSLFVIGRDARGSDIVIYGVSPSGIAPDGNVVVTVLGENFEVNCILPCPTRVLLGGAEVEMISVTRNQIVFRAPAHVPGVAELTIRRGDGATAKFTLTYIGSIDGLYEKVLLPIWIEQTPGAFGSEWTTALTLHNSGATSVSVAHVNCAPVCPPVFPSAITVQPKETVRNPDIARRKRGESPGRLIYITASGAPAVKASLNLRDHSRDPLYGGTELPVVREDDFFTTTAHIVDVAIDPRYRQALRIYDVDASVRGEFAVRIYALGGAPNAEPIVDTRVVTEATPADLAETPGYAQILDLSSLSPQVRAAGRLRIEIEPLSATRFWGFVSITEDATQRVATILPQ